MLMYKMYIRSNCTDLGYLQQYSMKIDYLQVWFPVKSDLIYSLQRQQRKLLKLHA